MKFNYKYKPGDKVRISRSGSGFSQEAVGSVVTILKFSEYGSKPGYLTTKDFSGSGNPKRIDQNDFKGAVGEYSFELVESRILKFKKNVVYIPENENEAKMLLVQAHRQGYGWCDTRSYLQETNWDKQGTYYRIVHGTYGLTTHLGVEESRITVKELFSNNFTPFTKEMKQNLNKDINFIRELISE